MQCVPAIVLRAGHTVRSILRQLEDAPDDAAIVVIGDDGPAVLYYTFDVAGLRAELAPAAPESLLSVTAFSPARVQQLEETVLAPGSVVLEGQQVIGVLRGAADVPTDTGFDDAQVLTVDGPFSRGIGLPTFGLPGPALPPPRQDITLRGADAPEEQLGVFRAYPDVSAPAEVVRAQAFTVTAGFATTPPESLLGAGPPILVTSGPNPEFVLQIVGFGFSFPDGVERTLTVDRDRPQDGRVSFTVVAEPAEAAAQRKLEISYGYAGTVVGRIWADIAIVTDPPAQPQAASIAATGPVAENPPGQGPHLSIDITSRPGDPQLFWRFQCRYPDIARPGEVATALTAEAARTFAVQLMRQLPNAATGGLLGQRMHGIGDDVADALPDEFWPMFEAVWQRALAAGDEPRLQITATEQWVPWELAWIGPERLQAPDELLSGEDVDGASLGRLWQVARWSKPTRRLPRGALPASPPAAAIAADRMVVITGDYVGTAGLTALPHAIEEGKAIASAYGALQLAASDADITSLMNGTLQRDGAEFAPTMLHFSGHAQTDVNNPQFTGLKLMGGALLDPAALRGFDLLADQQPFVFLNACEAGGATETLDRLGGIVGACLGEGTRGLVAPLWEVNDVEARDIAIEFYRLTLDEGATVGEAMQAIRRGFNRDSPSVTSLAYVFYGNPNLRLERTAP